MRRGKSKAEGLGQRRTRSAAAKAKARIKREGGAATLGEQLAAKNHELDEARRQQAATADVLRAISRSTFDLQSVLSALVESAAKLCEADRAAINRYDGSAVMPPLALGFSPESIAYVRDHPVPMGRGSTSGRAIAERHTIHIHDVLEDPELNWLRKEEATARAGGVRTILTVPLIREGAPIGVITLQRRAVRPFTKQQIELAEIFTDQAVIAIANTRLLSELRESLDQQTATSEVLQVISSSQSDLEPVFRAMLENATRLNGPRSGANAGTRTNPSLLGK